MPICNYTPKAIAVLGVCLFWLMGCAPEAQEPRVTDLTPLEEIVGVDFSDLDDANEQVFQTAQRRTQECMIGRGFEYSSEGTVLPDYPEGQGPGTVAWREQYGFGLTTTLFDQPLLPNGLIGRPVPGSASVTAQMQYVGGLGSSERAAYFEALMGSDVPGPDSSQQEVETYIATSDGCQAVAQRAALDGYPLKVLTDNFGSELAEVREAVESDPSMVMFENDMRTCMQASGYEWSTYAQVAESLTDRARSISVSPVDSQGSASPQFALSDSALDALRDLQAEELLLAGQFSICEESVGSRSDVFRELRVEYERRFMDRYAEELSGAGLLD